MTPRRFKTLVWAHARKAGRNDLPWRNTTDPYHVLVSEIMLQQTQVERVIPYYSRFLDRFPTVKDLADAPLRDVLVLWQGLGYNRRAKMLHDAAKAVMTTRGGMLPKTAQELVQLPGVGPYTAGAVAAFAFNENGIFIETNIRTAVTHHFFDDKVDVSDVDVRGILEKTFPKGRARDWYAALMDYGAHLKRSGVRINTKAIGYRKQSRFVGSEREARGAILRALSIKYETKANILLLCGSVRKQQLAIQLTKLLHERLVTQQGRSYRLSD